jgi:asparagine synthase (glutamine-hydrolysing)
VLHTFSVGYAGMEADGELAKARAMARQFGTRHHEIVISRNDFEAYLPTLVYHQDEPIADPVCVPIHFLSRAARAEGVIVAHVGEGADELFAGYPRSGQYFRAYERFWRPALRWPRALRGIARDMGGALLSQTRFRKYRGILDELERGGDLYWSQHVEFYPDERRALTHALQAGRDEPTLRVRAWHEAAKRAGVADYLGNIAYLELAMRLPELLLMRVDKLAMANSIEARVPFLDPRLVELAFGIPSEWKLRNGTPKALLRSLITRLVPGYDVNAPKVGFGVPFREWFGVGLDRFMTETIFSSALRKERLLDDREIERMFALTRAGKVNYHGHLWCLANLSAWYDRWIAGGRGVESGGALVA